MDIKKQFNGPYLKLYIAVLDEVPDFMVPTLVAHSMLGAHLQWQSEAPLKEFSEGTWCEEPYINWLHNSFRKCVVRVNRKEFEKIKQLDRSLRVLEISTKSSNPIGVSLSAFNLKFLDENSGYEYPLENIFQSSKSSIAGLFSKKYPYFLIISQLLIW